MNREREIQIIAEEICAQVPQAILSRTDGSLYLELPADGGGKFQRPMEGQPVTLGGEPTPPL